MKKTFKTTFSLLMALVMALSLSVSAFAADPTVDIVYKGKDKLLITPKTTEFTTTDLFGGGFKGVMPGDTRTETITFKNESTSRNSYVKLYIEAIPHNAANQPEDKAIADVEKMNEFLSQLNMTVYNGDKVIYQSSPDKTGKLTENVYLGQLKRNKSVELKVVLGVPDDLGNAYANRVGEVDWVFHADCYTEDSLIQTGQLNWPIPVLCGLGILLIAVGLFVILRKRRENRA